MAVTVIAKAIENILVDLLILTKKSTPWLYTKTIPIAYRN